MSAGMTRRDALRAVGLAFGLTVVADAARAFDLKELKQDVEAIKYDDEVQEVGPDPKEELLLREKKEKKADPVSIYSSLFHFCIFVTTVEYYLNLIAVPSKKILISIIRERQTYFLFM